MDVILKVKITILNQMIETVDMHGEAIVQVSTELVRQLSSLSSFKGDKRSAVYESKRVLGDLTKTIKALPSTIRISFRQVRHSVDDDNGTSSYSVNALGVILLLKGSLLLLGNYVCGNFVSFALDAV